MRKSILAITAGLLALALAHAPAHAKMYLDVTTAGSTRTGTDRNGNSFIVANTAIQPTGTQSYPYLTAAGLQNRRDRTATDAVGACGIVRMMAKARAAFAQFIQARIGCAYPQRACPVLGDEQQIVARQAVRILCVVAIVDEIGCARRHTVQSATGRRYPQAAVVRAFQVFDEIRRQASGQGRIQRKA